MSDIRIGVFGMRRGRAFTDTYKALDGVRLVSVCDADPQMLEKAKPFLPEDVQLFTDFDAFADSGLDAVVLANYFTEHWLYAVRAMKKGLAVLSETNAAPTLGECVKLCEAVEQTGGRYMLATNVPHMFGCAEMDRLYKGGSFGRVYYADAEYYHPRVPFSISPGETHWRRFLPRTYYNMHDLGTLMSITGTVPKKVNARAIFAPEMVADAGTSMHSGDVASVILTEMDNGALFRTTACASLGPVGKWFRLSCGNGTLETVRGDQDSIYYEYNPWAVPEGAEVKRVYDARPAVISDEQKAAGHGGSDYALGLSFIDFLNGKITPFFDVYRACALAAAGICAWRSVLADGKSVDIPDFTDKAQRARVADDLLTPFPKKDGSGVTLPCSSRPYTAVPDPE